MNSDMEWLSQWVAWCRMQVEGAQSLSIDVLVECVLCMAALTHANHCACAGYSLTAVS